MDRARNSYDATRQYRAVVAQQGRVTVEADGNEAEQLRAAASRAELVDIIGPTGTPDHGFQITTSGAFGVAIHAGTIYVGGLRVELAANQTYETQKPAEWADCPAPDPDVPTAGPLRELIYLELAEQEVSATEDPALREVALGGPDTAGRTRLIQRVRRAAMTGTECLPALIKVLGQRAPGLVFESATQQLRSKARLQVDFVPVPDADNACQPIAKAGFLGAENQLIRVQIASDGALLWGYDNASALYRVKPPSAAPVQALELEGVPVDELHRPRPHQWVEVLRTAVVLDGAAAIAAAVGEAHEIASYDVDSNTITLVTPLTGGAGQFARIWERKLTTTTGELVEAGGAGIGVQITATGSGAPGDYWMIGVRPSHPDRLDPARLAQPQPPDGPARWATPLATISWTASGATGFVHDCRRYFKPLTDDDDLAFHNQHLHGWGVVCGLQVRCMTEDIAKTRRLPRPREWVNVFNGYAIDPWGHDIRLSSGTRDKFTPLDLGELAVLDGALTRDAKGALADGSVSLWIDDHRVFHVDKFEVKRTDWADLLDGTLLLDLYNDCILKVLSFVRGELTPGEGLVSSGAKRLIAVLNLAFQLLSQTSGRFIYLSAAEDAVLRALYNGLKDLLASKSFCAMFDGVDYPVYDLDPADPNALHPTTIFGAGHHTRLRINSPRQLAFTCGTGAAIHVYDLKTRQIVAAVDFPVAGAEVQDVAFSIDGADVYATALIGSAQVDSLFVIGSINPNGTVTWSTHQVTCTLRLITLATDVRSPDRVFAAARGLGLYAFNVRALTATPDQLDGFQASGHLVATNDLRQTFLYAGEHTTSSNPVVFDQIRALGVLDTQFHQLIPLKLDTGASFLGEDLAIAQSLDRKVDDLYAIASGSTGTRSLLIWDRREGGRPQIVALGDSALNRVAYSPLGNWSLVTYEATFLGRAYRPKSQDLEPGLHPLQIAPIAVASDAEGRWFYVLEWASNTITAIPAAGRDAPWQSTVDLGKLERYRLAAILAFLRLLGRFAQYLKDCVCDHLLVNCPDPRGKKVYLADVSFKNGEVYQICNFHHRRYVHTFPTVEYWMSLVPALPALKLGVEKLCCQVLADVFERFQPPQDKTKDRGDAVSTTVLRNGLALARQANLGEQIKSRKAQLLDGAAIARTAATQQLAQPPAGKVTAPIATQAMIGGTADDATKLATSRGIAVRRVVVASDPIAAALQVGLATPTLEAHDRVDLITDANGKVLGLARVTSDAPVAAPDEVAALRTDLATMKDLHAKQLATITELQGQMKRLGDSIHALNLPPRP